MDMWRRGKIKGTLNRHSSCTLGILGAKQFITGATQMSGIVITIVRDIRICHDCDTLHASQKMI